MSDQFTVAVHPLCAMQVSLFYFEPHCLIMHESLEYIWKEGEVTSRHKQMNKATLV